VAGAANARAESAAASKPRAVISGAGLATALGRTPIAAILWAAALIHVALLYGQLQTRFNRLDFSSYYASAYALRHGIDPYTTDLTAMSDRLGIETGTLIHAADTPTFLLCFEPLTAMSPRHAYWTWTLLSLAALVAALMMLLGRSARIPRIYAWSLGALAVLYAPLAQNYAWGQSQVFVLLLLVVMMRAMERGRDGAAGLALAAAGLLRAYPLLLLGYLALRRRWRAMLFALGGLAAGGLATLALAGIPLTLAFVHGAAWVTSYKRTARAIDVALGPFVSRLFWYGFGAPLPHWLDLVRAAASLGAQALLLLATVLATIRAAPGEDRDWRVYSLWIATAIVLSPLAWPHYMVLLILPFIQLAAALNAGRARARAGWMALANFVVAAVALEVWMRLKLDGQAGAAAQTPMPLQLLAEGNFLAVALGYLAVYWFATDRAPGGGRRGT
jgi:alpha-1,2-mannosyltransferase